MRQMKMRRVPRPVPGATVPSRSARGIALIAVLWVVAIMSVICIGLVQSVRSELKVTSMDLERTRAQALGEAAIALAAQQLPILAREQPNQGQFELQVDFQGVPIAVRVHGLSGLVSLSSAPVEHLTLLFQNIGQLDPGSAHDLAVRVVQWRMEPTPQGGARQIEAPEDLLQIPGVSYELYARVADFVTANLGYGNLELQSSPPEIRALFGLQPGDTVVTSSRSGGSVDSTIRITALVPQGPTQFEVTRDMRVSSSPLRSGLYWQIYRSQIKVLTSSY